MKMRFGLSPLFRENFSVSSDAVKNNRLRSSLTVAIIATGITSLVGIMTAIDALKNSLNDSFGKMGANSFYITAKYSSTTSEEHKRVKNRRVISFSQARAFINGYRTPSLKTVYVTIGGAETFKTEKSKTEPRMTLEAADENYLDFQKINVDRGRGLSATDVETSAFNCVIGSRTAYTLFDNADPIGKVISVRGAGYKVVGVAERQGSSMSSFDNALLIPISNARMSYLNEESDYTIGVTPAAGTNFLTALDDAEILFRSVRRLSPYDETDFEMSRSDAISAILDEVMGGVTAAALVIGLITLLGAAVGLMNIMLVSVKERTREIGTRKALGAKSSTIRQQFFMESIIIGQRGCLIGIVIGTIAANLVLRSLEVKGVIPWFWMGMAVILCLIVSILSCYIPAKKAAALDPIEALRYE